MENQLIVGPDPGTTPEVRGADLGVVSHESDNQLIVGPGPGAASDMPHVQFKVPCKLTIKMFYICGTFLWLVCHFKAP